MASQKNRRHKGRGDIHHPHDKLFFQALQHHKVAKDAIEAYLPKSLLTLVDLSRIKLYQSKLVSPQFKAFQADVIYEMPFKDQSAFILFHCEQQSTVEPHMPLRIWQYLLLVLLDYAKNHPHRALPLVYPIILYTGKAPYTESTCLFDLFGEDKVLAKSILLEPIKLIDVHRKSDEDIKKRQLFGLTEYIFKHRRTQEVAKVLREILLWTDEVAVEGSKDYAKIAIQYMIDVYHQVDYDTFVAATKQFLSSELREETMTIAQQLREQGMQEGLQQGMLQGIQQGMRQGRQEGIQQGIQEGIQQGMRQGRQEGRQEGMQKGMQQGTWVEKCQIAKNLLEIGRLDVNTITAVTGLTLEEIKALQEKLPIV